MPAIRDNTALHRFEMDTEAGIAFANYRKTGDTLAIFHTEVPRALRGRGIGGQLATASLDYIRGQGLKVVPACSFMVDFMRRNPQYADLAP